MGVKGLRSFLRQRFKVSRRILSAGSTLVIDGDGWMFHLLQQCKGKLNMDTGGSYKEFASVVLAEVNRLKSYGLELVVLFDGPKNPLKDRTTIERLKKREREWASLHQSYSTESIPHSPEDFPIVPLCKGQLMASLDLCSVRHLHCIHEAEQEISLLVQQQNFLCTPDTRCFAYSQDTDFIVMKDCPYIEFGAIEVDEVGKACAEVWSRIEVCRGLTISEEQFLDFVLFLGNDYTAPLVVHTDLYVTMNRSFQGNVPMIMQAWLENLSNQQPEIGPLQAADLFRLLSASDNATKQCARLKQIDELQCAMDYSRALYNLEPLNHFYELGSVPQGAEDGLETGGFPSECIQGGRAYENVGNGALLTNVVEKGAPASPLTSSVPRYKPVRGSESFSRNNTAFKREPWSNGSRSNDARNIREPNKPSVYRSHYLAGSEESKPKSGEGAASGKPPSNAYERLPIDEHREKILSQIQSNRVTIIHGETGCGKSSRLPQFLLEDAEASQRHCKIFVSQPRRIGVVGMLKRLRPVLGDKVGMRMGYSVRDETEDTKINYVTTGYLVKLMAHRPEALRRCTHIVIDEVHERSVDGDLICLLVRDLLLRYSQLRVILMSATINTDLYQEYFFRYDDGTFGSMECLSVGLKRFPVKINYLEDLCKHRSNSFRRLAIEVAEEKPLTTSWSEAQYRLVVALLRVCAEGTTVLVFVSGMVDITAIAALLETSPQFLVCPLHSTTPDEEQEFVFEPIPPGYIKVVIATNIAESSVTIPDCDVVICLGTHKSNSFNESLQGTHVALSLLSKASATQRAGRTGRVRPGTVYRLYTQEIYNEMKEHELAEVLRRPLDDVMLNMWTVLENAEHFQGVTPFLQKLIEVPDMSCVETSFQRLCSASLITFPNDDGCLTPAGRFVSALPIDLPLGRMVSYGVFLGVPAEAIVMAASLSMSQPHPYRMANPIFQEPSEFNNQIRKRFLSEVYFDQGDYSEPIARIRLLLEWRALSSDTARHRFCHLNSLQFSIMKQFESTTMSLTEHLLQVQQAENPLAKRVNISSIATLTTSTINILRLIMLWAFSENILLLERTSERLAFLKREEGAFQIESDCVSEKDMKTLFGTIPYALDEFRPCQIYTTDYELSSTESDSYLGLVQLMNRLDIVAASYATQCFAVLTKTAKADETQVVIVVLPGEYFDSLTHAFHSYIQHGECNLGDQFAERLQGDCLCRSDAKIMACLDATQSEAGDVHDLLCSVPNSLIIHVADNLGCLESIATPLSPAHVAAIFGVNLDSDSDEKEDFDMEEPPEKITVLKFPNGKRLSESLIDDLPLGHRFVQCCRSNRKDYKLVLPQKKAETTDDDTIDAFSMEEPYKARRANRGPQREVSVSSVHPVWHLSSGDNRYVAKLPRQGMMSASFHCGADPLFAVAHKALPLTNRVATYFVVNGVTFLPTNPLWMRLALCAAGKDPLSVEEGAQEKVEEKETINGTAHECLQHLFDAARTIGQLLSDASNFERRDDIILGVHSLFRQFLSDPGSGEKVGVRSSDCSLSFNSLQLNSGELGSSKVVTLPPSAPKAVIPPRLSSDDMRVNQKHGYDQANDYKMAHEARKRAAPVTAPPATHKILPESTALQSISKEGTTVIPKHQHCVDSKFGSNEEGEEGEWEANVESFSARVRCASLA